MIMTEDQKTLLQRIETDFEPLWNAFCQYIPEAKEIVSIKDSTNLVRNTLKDISLYVILSKTISNLLVYLMNLFLHRGIIIVNWNSMMR